METATNSSGFQITQLTAINVAKIVTILCLITFMGFFITRGHYVAVFSANKSKGRGDVS